MSISVTCSGCSKSVKAPDEYAGRHVKCPGCGAEIDIPGGETPVKPPERPASEPDDFDSLIDDALHPSEEETPSDDPPPRELMGTLATRKKPRPEVSGEWELQFTSGWTMGVTRVLCLLLAMGSWLAIQSPMAFWFWLVIFMVGSIPTGATISQAKR